MTDARLPFRDRRRSERAVAAQLRSMVAGLNAVIWERDPHTWQVRFVNDRIEELLGHSRQRWLAEPDLWAEVIHPADRAAAVATVRRTVAEGEDFTLTYRARAADGRQLWLQHLGHVSRDGQGQPVALHAVLIDITEQRRREESAALLAAAGQLLAAPGPVEERLGAVAGLTVGVLCDRASVWLRGEDGRYRVVAAAPAGFVPRVLSLPPISVPAELEAAYRTGSPLFLPEVDGRLLHRAAEDDRHAEELHRLGTGSVLIAPLVTGGQVAGLLTLVTNEGQARDDAAALAVAGELGHRVAAMVAGERVAIRQRHLYELTRALAGASTVAEAAGEVAAGLQRVLGAAVVSVFTSAPDDALTLVHTVGYPAERLAGFPRLRLDAGLPATEAARTRAAVWLPDREAWQRRFPRAADALLPDTQAGVALPLLVGGRLLGVVGASFPTRRDFDADERGFLLTLAAQVAVAFERAALADTRREIADTLQQSLLPRTMPRLDRLAVRARYLPGSDGTTAGGDWYDVLPLGDGTIALVVGDVVGEGAPAAAVMGQLRSALAALLLEGHPPARALTVLDRFAEHVDGARVSTAACLVLDPASGTLTYSLAGHPPPLVLGRESARYLDAPPGPALAVPGLPPRSDAVTELAPGETLVLYTDGLVERRGAALDDGLARLAGLAAAARTAGSVGLVDGLLAGMLQGAGPADDVAVLAARLLPRPLRLDLPADPARLRWVRQAVQGWAADAGIDRETAADLQLALGEAVANAVEHAYRAATGPGAVAVGVALDADDGIAVEVIDSGVWRPVPADPGFRGRGLRIIRELAGPVDLRAGGQGTTLRFRVPLPTGTAPVAGPAGDRPERPAELRQTDLGGGRCLELSGDLDLAGVAAVRDALLGAVAAGSAPVTLDLTGLGHLSSVGMGLLLEVVRAAGDAGTQLDVVLPADGPARRALELTGMAEALHRPHPSSSGGSPP